MSDPTPKNVRLLNNRTGAVLPLELADVGLRDGIRTWEVITPAAEWMNKFDTMLIDEIQPQTAIHFPSH